MATCRLILDKAAKHANGLCPIKLVITNSGSTCRIYTGFLIKESQWSPLGSVVKHADAKEINAVIRSMRNKAEDLCMQATMEYGPRFQVSIIRDQIEQKETEEGQDVTIYEAFEEIINDTRKSLSTRKGYASAYNIVREFAGNKKILWAEMDSRWLDRLDAYMSAKGLRTNSRATTMSRLRGVFNHARRFGYTEKYPFLMFSVKYEKTRHRALTVEQLRALFSWNCKGDMHKFQLASKLIFLLRGISVKDLCYLEMKNVVNGFIEYKRFKTGRLYTIKLEPEMQSIIDELHTPGSKYLISIMDHYVFYTNFDDFLNRALRKMGKQKKKDTGAILPSDVTSYWLRHSWATIASGLDIPKETISSGLGHEIGSSITSIYIDYDQKKVDLANRRIIDYVLYNKDYRDEK